MGDVIYLFERYDQWREIFVVDNECSTLRVYANCVTGEIDVVQSDDNGDTIRTTITAHDAEMLVAALAHRKKNVR